MEGVEQAGIGFQEGTLVGIERFHLVNELNLVAHGEGVARVELRNYGGEQILGAELLGVFEVGDGLNEAALGEVEFVFENRRACALSARHEDGGDERS